MSAAPLKGALALTQAQRAAVVLAVLGETNGRPIADKLDDDALARVAQALGSLAYLSREEVASIVMSFLTELRGSAGALRGGKTRAREVLSGLVDPARLQNVFGEAAQGEVAPDASEDAWTRLSKGEAKSVAAYLGRHSPATIALMLRKLDATVISTLLVHLPEEKLAAVMGAMVDHPQSDPAIEKVLARMIELEFLNAGPAEAGEKSEHLEGIGEVLSLLPPDKRDRLVEFLTEAYGSKLDAIRGGLLTIDVIPKILPRNAVPIVFRELDGDVCTRLIASLQGEFEAVSDYLLANISSRMAEQFRDDVKRLGPVAPSEAETIHKDFLMALMTLKRNGAITLERPPRA